MSQFLNELNMMIQKKKISKNKLAARIGVDPSSFYQMLSGKRYMNETVVHKIIRVLNLSPDEEDNLCSLYRILLMGEEKFHAVKTVVRFIEKLNMDQDDIAVSSFKLQGELTSEVICGPENVNKIIFQIILNAYEKKEELKILCQPDCEAVSLLLGIFRDSPQLAIEQIVCLDSGSSGSGTKNMEMLTRIIPCLTGRSCYSVYYFYDSVQSRYGTMSLMPCLIVSDSMGMVFSADLKDGLFFEDPDKVRLFQRQYAQIKSHTSIFTTNDIRVQDLKNVLSDIDFQKSKEKYILSPMLPLLAGYSSDFWISLIKPDAPVRNELIHFLKQDSQLATFAGETTKNYGFFTRKGLMDFYENGHIIDALSEYFVPIPVSKRKIFLRKLLTEIESGKIHAFLLKDDAIQLSRDFYMCLVDRQILNCSLRKKDNSTLMLTFFENSLCHTVYDFMMSLKKSDMVETQETMTELLKGLLGESGLPL